MTRVRVAGFTVSLDGYGAGPNQGISNPLGVARKNPIAFRHEIGGSGKDYSELGLSLGRHSLLLQESRM
jgi:hypothetical protein